MKWSRIFSTLTVAMLAALPLAAQQKSDNVARVTAWKIKPGMVQQFEQGLKRHNEFHHKQQDKSAFYTFQVISGEGTGIYLRVAVGRNWEDFDAEEKTAAADAADSATNVLPYIEGGITRYYVFLPDVSRPTAGDEPSALASVLTFHLKIGQTEDFLYSIRKIHEAIGKTNWPVNYEWYTLVNGGEGPTFVLVLPRKNWADFKEPAKSFDKMLDEAFGHHEAELLLKHLDSTIHSEGSEIVRYRPDLSYRPEK